MEVFLFLIVVAGTISIAIHVRNKNRELKKATLDQAWREVLADPDYMNRRDREERKLQFLSDAQEGVIGPDIRRCMGPTGNIELKRAKATTRRATTIS